MTKKTIKFIKNSFAGGVFFCICFIFFSILSWIVEYMDLSNLLQIAVEIACLISAIGARVFIFVAAITWFYRMLEEYDEEGNPINHVENKKI